jgi:hypothetical protein
MMSSFLKAKEMLFDSLKKQFPEINAANMPEVLGAVK